MKKIILTAAICMATAAAASAQTATPKIDERQEVQQNRIEQGVKSGELTAMETRTLERKQGAIEAKKLNSKADDMLTSDEREKIRNKQNKAGRSIARKKTNSRTQ